MQNGSLEWHKKRRAAKTTSHFIRNQIEDYKRSQERSSSTRLRNSPVFLKKTTLVFFFFVSTLCCPATQQRSSFLRTAGLGLSCFALSWAPPSPWTAYSHQPFNTCDYLKLPSCIGRLARSGTHALGFRGTDDRGAHGRNRRGCFGLAKQEGWN